MVFNNILETIGKTPLIRLNNVVMHIPATVYAKVEAFNPGLSAKDRIALHMIERAERLGLLQPGGTVVDATSGNTGFSLAMVAAIKGYRCVLTVTSKISEDKLNNLRAMGAEVHLWRTRVDELIQLFAIQPGVNGYTNVADARLHGVAGGGIGAGEIAGEGVVLGGIGQGLLGFLVHDAQDLGLALHQILDGRQGHAGTGQCS